MLRDYLKVEKEDRLVEQQSRHDNSQHYSSVTEWVILSKDGQRKGRVSLFDRFTTFVNGVFDLTALVFYASVIVLGLFLTVQSLEKRRYN